MPQATVTIVPPNRYFNTATTITTADANTAVVAASAIGKAHITDIVIVSAGAGAFTLTDDAGTALLGPILVEASVPFIAHFGTPLINSTTNDQVEMDKSAGVDDWQVYLAGYYAA